jgi:hypothetical protein
VVEWSSGRVVEWSSGRAGGARLPGRTASTAATGGRPSASASSGSGLAPTQPIHSPLSGRHRSPAGSVVMRHALWAGWPRGAVGPFVYPVPGMVQLLEVLMSPTPDDLVGPHPAGPRSRHALLPPANRRGGADGTRPRMSTLEVGQSGRLVGRLRSALGRRNWHIGLMARPGVSASVGCQ